MSERHDRCRHCGETDPKIFGSLVTWTAMGIVDIGSGCCLQVNLAEFVPPPPPRAMIHETIARKLLALNVKVA